MCQLVIGTATQYSYDKLNFLDIVYIYIYIYIKLLNISYTYIYLYIYSIHGI